MGVASVDWGDGKDVAIMTEMPLWRDPTVADVKH